MTPQRQMRLSSAIRHGVLKRLEARRRARRERRLVYCYKRCACGALYAYDPATIAPAGPRPRAWDCSDILLGAAVPSGKPGALTHGDTMPFIFWKVKEAPRDWALEHRVERSP
jgi:hypothetical protein